MKSLPEKESRPLTSQTERYRQGSLVYTKAGLFTLFAYLLWGDFCFSLMEAIWPKILPLMLKAEGTPNVLISLVITTVPSLMNLVMNPIVGTASDRFRSRLGRRIPFLLFATPFIAFFLIVLGFSRELGAWVFEILAAVFPSLSLQGVTIAAARMIKRHFENIITYLRHPITNAVTEGLNSKIQAIKANARGFRSFANYRTRILFFCGKLNLHPL